MDSLKPWIYGPFEMLKHAEGHLKAGSDFDKRIALISYDNTIEVAITTFLQLHPLQRGGRTYSKEEVSRWLNNYHSKLDFFENYISSNGLSVLTTRAEIIWYHNLRNELYHSGNGMIPEERSLVGARLAAIWIFSVLFDVDGETLVGMDVPAPKSVLQDGANQLSAQMHFLKAFIEFERILSITLQIVGEQKVKNNKIVGLPNTWNIFIQVLHLPEHYNNIVIRAIPIRNDIVHGHPINTTEKELLELSHQLDQIAKAIHNHSFSIDILFALRKHYSQWLLPDIRAVTLVKRNRSLLLEVVRAGYKNRIDISFLITEEDEEEEENSYQSIFPTDDLTDQENAEWFIENCWINLTNTYPELFTSEGCIEIINQIVFAVINNL